MTIVYIKKEYTFDIQKVLLLCACIANTWIIDIGSRTVTSSKIPLQHKYDETVSVVDLLSKML